VPETANAALAIFGGLLLACHARLRLNARRA